MYSSAYLPLINRTTRVTENTATFIDNIYTNHIQQNTNSCNGILFTDVSDHFPIFCVHDLFKQDKLIFSEDYFQNVTDSRFTLPYQKLHGIPSNVRTTLNVHSVCFIQL